MSLMAIPVGDPQLIVDLSNVCRDESLGASPNNAAWSRFERVIKAWKEQIEPSPQGVAIADENLRFLLGAADRRQFELAERAGLVRVVRGSADTEILRWAQMSGASVLSKDRFVGHRREHPWIQGTIDRFYMWEARRDGSVRIVAAAMGTSGAYSVSRGEEADLLKARGLDPRRPSDREILMHAYRCANLACLTARFSPDRLLVPPAQSRRQPVCPGCGRPLEDLGPRPGAVEIVIEDSGRELARRLVEEGATVTLGRSDVPKPREESAVRTVGRVSRSHISLRVERSRLRICDLDSRNGTAVLRWDSVARSFGEPQPIAPGEYVDLGPRDAALLGGTLRVRRSGQQFATGAAGSGGRVQADSTTSDPESAA